MMRHVKRISPRRLADLEPSLVCFGHGEPLRDPDRLRGFAGEIPAKLSGRGW